MRLTSWLEGAGGVALTQGELDLDRGGTEETALGMVTEGCNILEKSGN